MAATPPPMGVEPRGWGWCREEGAKLCAMAGAPAAAAAAALGQATRGAFAGVAAAVPPIARPGGAFKGAVPGGYYCWHACLPRAGGWGGWPWSGGAEGRGWWAGGLRSRARGSRAKGRKGGRRRCLPLHPSRCYQRYPPAAAAAAAGGSRHRGMGGGGGGAGELHCRQGSTAQPWNSAWTPPAAAAAAGAAEDGG
eukprot:1025052-Pelagomonas_calceolata.AAC.6